MIVGLYPFSILNAGSAAFTPFDATVKTKESDPSTMDDWTKYFGPTVFSTENAGGVWTDKSVFTNANAFAGTGIEMINEDNFLVALSAIASNMSVEGMQYAPTDTILILDVSGSMDVDRNALADEMVAAANASIAKLLSDSKYNRVGVIAYSEGSATTLLPLGRYTTGSDGQYLNHGYKTGYVIFFPYQYEAVFVDSDTRIEGTSTAPTDASVAVEGATYIQSGLMRAIDLFTAQADNTTVSDPALGTLSRIPVVVLMTDGAPTYGTTNFTNPGSAEFGEGNETTAALGFVTQLTIAYAKEKIIDTYGGCLLYTLGLGVGSNSIAKSVLNPSWNAPANDTEANAIKEFWSEYEAANVGDTIAVTSNRSVTKINTELDQNYVDAYYETEDDLESAFEDIVKQIELQSTFYPTLVEGSENLSGYVSFVDKLGKYMNVTDVKGLLIENVLHTGETFAEHLIANKDSIGTVNDTTSLSYIFLDSVMQRLDISRDTATSLISMACQHGQLAYDAAKGTYSNYIGWYSDANDNFVGFWHEGIEEDPSLNAAYINRSYGFFGDTDKSLNINDHDMLYATVRVRENIVTGEMSVAFAVPAALIPTVTYNVSLSESGNLSGISITGATSPIRLVYEAGLNSEINEITVKSIATDAEYLAHHVKDGNYEFYTNLWFHTDNPDEATEHGTSNTYAYFTPSKENERYYYTSNSPIYTNTNGSLYTGASAPSATGTYYRGTKVYSIVNGEYKTTTAYEQISADSLSKAVRNTADNTWYIPAGTVHTYLENFNTPKTENTTESLEWSDVPFVDINNANEYYVGAVLGNNGRIIVTPATAIKISKTAIGSTDNFEFVVTNTSSTADAEYNYYHVDSDGEVTTKKINFIGGKATITLKNGENAYISGLTAGHVFTIEEPITLGYVVSSITTSTVGKNNATTVTGTNKVTVTASDKDIQSAAFVNVTRGTGNLTIAKEVSHDLGSGYAIPEGTKFEFTVKFEGFDLAGKTYAAENSGDTTIHSITVDANGEFSFTLGHDEEFEVYGLPEGVVATVVEKNIPTGFTAAYYEGTTPGDGKVTIVKDNTVMVEVRNSYKATAVTVGTQIVAKIPKKFVNNDANKTEITNWGSQTFTAELQKYNGQKWETIQTANATDSNKFFEFNFSGEKYETAGTYSYQILEVIPAENERGTILYDRTIHTFTVTVGDADMNGQLEIISVTSNHTGENFPNNNDVWTVPATFTNIQEQTVPAVVQIPIQKVLINESGSNAVSLSGYIFELYCDEACSEAVQAGVTPGIEKLDLAQTDNIGEGTIDITINESGSYTFYVKEKIGNINNMTYSNQVVKVTVEVTQNTDRLIANTSYSIALTNDKLVFTNTYAPDASTIEIDVRKKLDGRTLNANEFSFTLIDADGKYTATLPGNLTANYSETVTNTADGDVPFTALTFTKVGTYTFNVKEEAGQLGGVNYDAKVHTVLVTVEDINGVLSASYVIKDTAENYIIFTNKYTATPVSPVVNGQKNLVDRTLLNDEFGFTLIACDEKGNPLAGAKTYTTRNHADATFKFDLSEIQLNAAGKYFYLVSEIQENLIPGVQYDTTKYIVEIIVEDNLQGAYVIKDTIYHIVDNGAVDSIIFTNKYVPTAATVDISGKKHYQTEINGETTDKEFGENAFYFRLYNSNSNWDTLSLVESVGNLANGTFQFTTLKFDTKGQYYYLVKELNGDSADPINGIKYDSKVYGIRIDVEDNTLTGALTAKATYFDENGLPTGTINFTNNYVITEGTTVILSGTKELSGRDLVNEEFSFELYEADENGNITNTTALQTVKNNANGTFTFAALEFNGENGNKGAGTYYYVIKEVNNALPGVTYDATAHLVTVTVTNTNGTLTAAVSTSGNIVFKNTYTAQPAKVTLGGLKTLTGRTLNDKEFSFTLTDANNNNVVNNGQTILPVSNDKDGIFAFPTLVFDKVGTYTYYIKEVIGFAGGVTYDTKIYEVVIVVEDNGSGQLTATVTVNSSGSTVLSTSAAAEITVKDYTSALGNLYYINFANTYTAENAALTFEGDKALVGRNLKEGEFSFTITGENGYTETVKVRADGSFSFSAITYTMADVREEPYVYTVEEVIGSVEGIVYDTTKYTIKVKVSDNGKGQIVAEITEGIAEADAILFTNIYNANPAQLHFNGIKHLDGRDLKAGDFSFNLVLEDINGTVIETVSNAANGYFEFTALDYKMADVGKEFTYFVHEVIPDDANKFGVTYDETKYKIVVSVTYDNTNGIIKAKITSVNGEAYNENAAPLVLEFNNHYAAADSEKLVIGGTKVLDGRKINQNDAFTFILKDSEGNEIERVNCDTDGKFSFTGITYTEADVGTHYYTVSELEGNDSKIKYDNTVYTVTVVVSDNFKGKIVAEASVSKAGIAVVAEESDLAKKIVFTNIYTAAPGSITFDGTKILFNTDVNNPNNKVERPLDGGEFSFTLTDEYGNTETVTNDENGYFTFSEIKYTKPGNYKYTISEVKGEHSHIVYDDTVYNITVKVEDKDGVLTCTVENPVDIEFINSYLVTPAYVELSGTKTLEGRSLRSGEFSFIIEDKDGNEIETVTNNANGKIVFTKLEYLVEGTYDYIISEIAGTKGGITYDTNVYNVTVTVSDDGNGTLTSYVYIATYIEGKNQVTVKEVSADAINFHNKYDTKTTATQISGIKILKGRELKKGEFEFELIDESDTVIGTATNKADGSFKFDSISYSTPGNHTYRVVEKNNGLKGVTYDDSVFYIYVSVKDTGNGTLTASVTIPNDIVFTNEYHVKPISATFSATKVLEGRELKSGEFRFNLRSGSGHIIETVKNDADGNIEFAPVIFNAPGTYTFYIEEIKGKNPAITYDVTMRKIVVIVTDNGDGTLSKSSEGTNDIVFTNTYEPKPTEAIFSGNKVLEGRPLVEGEFSFVLKDKAGNVIETVTNTADGSFSFSAIKYTAEGTYEYTISEVIGSLENVTYDKGVYSVTVTVVDNNKGALVATVSGGNGINFTNIYVEPEETTTPEETTEVPEDTTSPEDTTEVPEVTTAPEDTTEVPEVTTSPEDTTEVPEVTTSPEDTTEVPEVTTSPEDTTEVPEVTTAPEDTTEIPEVTTSPEDTTEVPEVTTGDSEDTETPNPSTGDGNRVIIWFGAAIVAFCATAGALFSKKREVESDNE